MIETLVVFGAGGDLTGRLLLPAVAALLEAGELSPDLHVIGAGNQNWTGAEFADHVLRRLTDHAQHVDPAARDLLIAALRYRHADVTNAGDVAAVLNLAAAESGDGPVAVYLALPTQLMVGAIRGLHARGLPAGSRVAVEKPFGYDAASAAELNNALAGIAGSRDQAAVYRVDHVLAMTAVQQLPQARFPATRQPIEWDSQHIAQVDLLFEETLALEGRASFYDRAGALRDVMQNHLTQILCTIAQPHPSVDPGSTPTILAEARASVLRTVRPLTPADVITLTRRARYSAGRLAVSGGADGRLVPDYETEHGVDPARHTETFAEVVLQLDSPAWTGTRFLLRVGKALKERRRGVRIHLRSSHHGAEDPVWLDLDGPTSEGDVGAEPLAYVRIMADLLSGGTTFAVGGEEAELAWRVFTPVLEGWDADAVPLTTYPAGSSGPRASEAR